MGGQTFITKGRGKTAAKAFEAAKNQAYYDYGHRGYTGSLAEKNEFTVISVPSGEDPVAFANTLTNEGDPRIDDKWGPAGCVKVANGEFLFFGWASS